MVQLLRGVARIGKLGLEGFKKDDEAAARSKQRALLHTEWTTTQLQDHLVNFWKCIYGPLYYVGSPYGHATIPQVIVLFNDEGVVQALLD